jgi:hypothetical protein
VGPLLADVLLTSDTVEPIGKLEFFWRLLAGPVNFLPV